MVFIIDILIFMFSFSTRLCFHATNTGDEEDGYDETLIPVDFQQMGQIRDDDILRILVKPMPAGCNMTCLMDCCHSGTVMDLPYRFTADGDKMVRNSSMNFDKWAGVAEGKME